jgi:hypothetical protein
MATNPAVAAYDAPQARWQDRYALPDWQQRLTTLDPDQEALFRMWARANKVPLTDDYDMRGFWLHRGEGGQGTARNPNDHLLHYPDTYKTPLHDSFSGESIYADPRSKPPRWNKFDQLVARDGTILFDERNRSGARAAVRSYDGGR